MAEKKSVNKTRVAYYVFSALALLLWAFKYIDSLK